MEEKCNILTYHHHQQHYRHHHHHFIEKPLKCNNSTGEKIHFRNFSVPWCRRDLLSGQLGNLSLFSFVCFAPRLNLYPHTSQQAKPPGLEQNNEECGDKHSLSAPFSSKLFFTIFLTDFLLLWNILRTSLCLPEVWKRCVWSLRCRCHCPICVLPGRKRILRNLMNRRTYTLLQLCSHRYFANATKGLTFP